MPTTIEEHRPGPARGGARAHWWTQVVRDVQFWIPVAVLAGGLLVLRWIS
ncbi:MAG TPA: hypothetical protein VFJ20_07335 [Gemmatimonadaceae bacterium]|nr:hypothetical protein [Gemmatimonadaceae bacterium]